MFGFTLFILLDTFVISSVYQTDTTAMNMDLFNETITPAADTEEPVITTFSAYENESSASMYSRSKPASDSKSNGRRKSDASETSEVTASTSDSELQTAGTLGSWQDENITVTVTEYVYNDTAVYAADIQLSSAQYLKTAFAENKFGKNITAATSVISSAHNGILAINGDFYGAQERGYVIRNGIVYRETPADADVLCIFADGSMKIIDPAETSAQELAEQGAWQAFSFGPALIKDGVITAGINEEVGRAMASNPRTAIGIIDDLHYVFVVSDGRTEASEGLSL